MISLNTQKWIMIGIMAIITVIFGLLPIKLLSFLKNQKSGTHQKASLILSLLSCFAGGVFLTVCFLDMFPDSLEAWENVQTDTGFNSGYPFVELISLMGFFLVYLLEEMCTSLCHFEHSHSHLNIQNIESNITFPRARLATVGTIFDVDGNFVQSKTEQSIEGNEEKPIRKSIVFTTAFIFHVFFECFAFGVQQDELSITSLFLGIILHKSIVMFSLGMKLTSNHPKRTYIVVILLFILALFNIIGGSIGMLIENSSINETSKDICTATFMSFSLGTFVYITFFEMLSPEKANNHSNLLQWFSSFIGFLIISIIMIWSN